MPSTLKWFGVQRFLRTKAVGPVRRRDADYDPDGTLVEERIIVVRARDVRAASAVKFSAVADLDDGHQFRRVVDLVENSVVALANAIFFGAAELLAAVWARVASEQLDLRDHAPTIGLRKIADLLGRLSLDLEPIASHVA
jgi:hypothetical protein